MLKNLEIVEDRKYPVSDNRADLMVFFVLISLLLPVLLVVASYPCTVIKLYTGIMLCVLHLYMPHGALRTVNAKHSQPHTHNI